MKKALTIILGASLIVSSCTTHQAAGVYTGSMFGDMLGSAIGGIVGGWRGQQLGSLIGTVGGAAVGAAAVSQSERNHERQVQRRAQARRQRASQQRGHGADDSSYYPGNDGAVYDGQGASDQSGFDPQMRGDDRITFEPADGNAPSGSPTGSAPTGSYRVPATTPAPAGSALIIRNAGVYEEQRDGVLSRGETCQVVFEITNTSDHPVNDVFPLVEEVTGCRHVHISPNLRVESIGPHQSIRYTASLHADNRLRDGNIEVRVGVAQGNRRIDSQTRQFTVPTARRAR